MLSSNSQNPDDKMESPKSQNTDDKMESPKSQNTDSEMGDSELEDFNRKNVHEEQLDKYKDLWDIAQKLDKGEEIDSDEQRK
jgi:hypothetical protein